MSLAALRNLDIFPIEHEGAPMICLRDPEGYAAEHVVLSPQAFFVAACLDGHSDIVDIQEAFARQFRGAMLMSEDIMRVVNYLEERGFLLSERYATRRRELETDFARQPTRPAWCAGKSYSSDEKDLRAFLDDMLGPETRGHRPAMGCLVVPHIDFDRGAEGYKKGYRALRESTAPELALVFGVAHSGGETPFILTRKHFETPLGTVKTDRELVDRLAARCTAFDPFAAEILHRTEHSVEFHALMLAHLYGSAIRIVPILCGSVFENSGGNVQPCAGATEMLAECNSLVRELAPKVLVIAGADLAHVGKRFGDAFDISPEIIKSVETRDRQDLGQVCAGDAQGFHESLMRDGNVRRVCGHACIYAALKSMEGSVRPGELFQYGYAHDPLGGIVSFAAAGLPYA